MARKRGGVFEKGVDTPNAHYDTVPEIMVHEGSKLFFILGYFLHFYPLNNWKNQNLKRMKKNSWRYLHFTQMYQKSWSYAMLFLRCVADVMVSFHFGSFFYRFYPPPLPPNSQKTQNLKKMKKKSGIYYHFMNVYQKLWSDNEWFLRYGVRHTAVQIIWIWKWKQNVWRKPCHAWI